MGWQKTHEAQWRFFPTNKDARSIVRIIRVKRGVYEMQIPPEPGVYSRADAPIKLEYVRTLPEAQAVAKAVALMQRSE